MNNFNSPPSLPSDTTSELEESFNQQPPATSSYTDPYQHIFLVAQQVARAQGIYLKKPFINNKNVSVEEYLKLIAKHNSLKIRKIKLKTFWWYNDCGPILGSYQDKPCALIPNDQGIYTVYNALQQPQFKVKENLPELAALAFTFLATLPLEKMKFSELLTFTFSIVKKHLLKLFLYQIITSILLLFIPIFEGVIFDEVIPGSNVALLSQYIVLLLIITIVTSLIHFFQASYLIRFQIKATYRIQIAMWDRLLHLPMLFFKDYTVGDLSYRINIVNTIQSLLNNQILVIALSAMMLFTNLLLMLYISPTLTAWVSVGIFIVVILNILGNLLILRQQRKILLLDTKLYSILFGLVNAIVRIRSTNQQASALSHWSKGFNKKISAEFIAARFQYRFQLVNFSFISIITLIFYGLISLLDNPLSFGNFIVFNAAFMQFSVAILAGSRVLNELVEIKPLFNLAKPIFDAIPEIPLILHNIQLKGSVTLKNVTFRYPNRDKFALVNFNLEVKPGSFTAIVGPSGAGKSTIFRLLLGLDKAESGTIQFDGININNLSLKNIRSQIGCVLQTTQLIPGSLFDNIVGINRHLTVVDANAIAAQVGLRELVSKLPMGMETLLTDGIQTLSKGEMQRIYLARAIASAPKLILLDEATSSLDNKMQREIQVILEKMNITRIVIAHRFSSIRHADIIHVLDKGCCIESGSYHELMAKKGLFYSLSNPA